MLHFQLFVSIAFILASHAFESLTSPESSPCLKVLSPVADLTTIHDKLDFRFSLDCQWPRSPSASSIAHDAMVHYCVALTTHTDAFERCFNNVTKLAFDENSGWIYLKEQQLKGGHNVDCVNLRVLEMIEQCSPQSSFQITGFKSNTFAITAYIKVLHQALESAPINTDRFFFTTALLDTNNPMKALPSFDYSFQQLQQRYPTLFNKPGIVDSILGKNVNHQLNNFFHVNDANGVARRFMRYPRLPFVKQPGDDTADSASTSVLIYMKEMQRHGANNRLITWACGLSSQGQTLSSNLRVAILTSDTEANEDLVDYLNNKCHVSIYLSEALSLPHVDGILIEQVLTSDAIQLIEWVSTFHVLILTNSNGDKQTDMLLMNYLPRCEAVPLTIVDASNPVVPRYWLDYIDAVIAPSKAAAFYNSMPLWETTGWFSFDAIFRVKIHRSLFQIF